MDGCRLKKWMRYAGCLIFLVGSLTMVPPAGADEFAEMQSEFEAFKKKEADFDHYKAQVDTEFRAYKRIIQEEFKAYRDRILSVWDTLEVSTKKRYVGYSSDYRVKKVVDYGRGTITIRAVVPKRQGDATELLGGYLKDLVRQDTANAYKQDAFTQGVARRLKESVDPSHLKLGQVEKRPLVADMVTGKLRPTTGQVDAAVADLMKQSTITEKRASKIPQAQVVSLTVNLPKEGVAVKAKGYLPDVMAQAGKRGVNPALVFAVMETESAFNPMARSYVPAYGLMQIVPRSAGRDASKLVLGKDLILSPSYLYNGKNNITMGVAYLYILNDRYLSGIKNPESRLYCVIAAYNTGAGNVARTFVGTTHIKKAVRKINALSPEAVYKVLRRKLPHKETRNYLERVSKRMETYEVI